MSKSRFFSSYPRIFLDFQIFPNDFAAMAPWTWCWKETSVISCLCEMSFVKGLQLRALPLMRKRA